MFREMRRSHQALPAEEISAVLNRCTSGVLALSGDDGYPYALPISYVYDGDRLYFHAATTGHKLDAIRRNPRASFCVVDQDRVVPEAFTSHYRSVIAFGQIRVVEDDAQKRAAIEKLAAKYAPNETPEHRSQSIEQSWSRFCMLEMRIEHVSGKAARELLPPSDSAQD